MNVHECEKGNDGNELEKLSFNWGTQQTWDISPIICVMASRADILQLDRGFVN